MKTDDTYIFDTSFSNVTDHVTRNTNNAGVNNEQEEARLLFHEILKENAINHDNLNDRCVRICTRSVSA